MSQNMGQVLVCTFVTGDEALHEILGIGGHIPSGTTHLHVQGHAT